MTAKFNQFRVRFYIVGLKPFPVLRYKHWLCLVVLCVLNFRIVYNSVQSNIKYNCTQDTFKTYSNHPKYLFYLDVYFSQISQKENLSKPKSLPFSVYLAQQTWKLNRNEFKPCHNTIHHISKKHKLTRLNEFEVGKWFSI